MILSSRGTDAHTHASTIIQGAQLSPRPDCHLHSSFLTGLPIEIEIVFLCVLSELPLRVFIQLRGGLGGGDNAGASQRLSLSHAEHTRGNKTQTYASMLSM